MDAFAGILTSFGLSSSAGLNAYLPLLIVALLSRFTDLIRLNEPFDALESWWTIGVLIVLASIEFLADKIPVVDTINDVVQTLIRPIAGAILFAASTNAIAEIHPVPTLIGVVLLLAVSIIGWWLWRLGRRRSVTRDAGAAYRG
jgi:hypothetical protein